MIQNSWSTEDTFLQCQGEYNLIKDSNTEMDDKDTSEVLAARGVGYERHLSIIRWLRANKNKSKSI